MISAEEAVKLTPSDNLDDAMLIIENFIKDAASSGRRCVIVDGSNINNFHWIKYSIMRELSSNGYRSELRGYHDLRIYW